MSIVCGSQLTAKMNSAFGCERIAQEITDRVSSPSMRDATTLPVLVHSTTSSPLASWQQVTVMRALGGQSPGSEQVITIDPVSGVTKVMPRSEQPNENQVTVRLRALLRGAFAGPPTPLKDIPKRSGRARKSAKKKAGPSSAATAKSARPAP